MSHYRPTEPDLRFDPAVPRPARVYAYWLGGKDHYPADRVAAEEVIACRPQVVAGARANRAFLERAVQFLASECGIRQFVDIGTGLPAPENTHEVAQAIAPDCRIVYVDNDPLVLVHARALLTSTRKAPVTTLRRTCVTLPPSLQVRRRRWIWRGPPLCCYWQCCISSPTQMTRRRSSLPWPVSWRQAAMW